MPSTATARKLRRTDTDTERKLWRHLRDRRLDGLNFKRQVIIDDKIADFVCWDARLIVEVDGGQHAGQVAQDLEHTRVLENAGFLVLRFWNNEVLSNTEGVLTVILDHVVSARRNPSPQPSQGLGPASCPSSQGRGTG